MDVRARTKAPVNEFGSLGASTESLCRTLRAYRKRLANSSDNVNSELVKEVERELALTARAIGERAKSKAFDETTVAKLLDQYSERLVSILDEKIAATMALRVRENSESGMSGGLASPLPDQDAGVDGGNGTGREMAETSPTRLSPTEPPTPHTDGDQNTTEVAARG